MRCAARVCTAPGAPVLKLAFPLLSLLLVPCEGLR